MFILTCLLVAQFIFSLVIFTVHFVTQEGVCWKYRWLRGDASMRGYFRVILVMILVLTSESIMIMIRYSFVLDILLGDRYGH